MSGKNENFGFLQDVFPAELEEITQRRKVHGIDPPPNDGGPSAHRGLVGLAISGGGIRSTTFSLGVVQALAKHKILKFVDYLSTVSGGGYLGSCLSSLLNQPHTNCDDDFPLYRAPGAVEPPAVRHLRNSSRYLAPSGIADSLRIPTLLLRGILINFLMFLPWIMIAVLVTEVIYEKLRFLHPYLPWVPYAAIAAFLILVGTFPFVAHIWRKGLRWPRRNNYEALFTWSFAVSLLVILAIPVFRLVQDAIETSPHDVVEALRKFQDRGADNYVVLFVVMAVSVGLMIVSRASAAIGRLRNKLLVYAAGLLGPLSLFALYLGLCVLQVDSHYIPDPGGKFQDSLNKHEVSPDLAQELTVRGVPFESPWNVEGSSPSWLLLEPEWSCPIEQRSNQVLELMCSDLWDDDGDSVFLSLTLVLVLLNFFYLDVNLSSIHPFYRDRLSKAYLVHTSHDGSLNHNDEQKLSQLNSEGSPAPYHLINTALNLQASRDPDLRGRKAGIFLFSKRFTGSERTGYCRTEEMEADHPRLDLGTAMAISGAAAAPNMGVTTIGPLVFIMTMLNIRLGYWLPNPFRFGKQGWWRAFWRPLALRGAWPRYLWREALGDVNEEKTYVNVSDGGHIENLGVYELLRRRCRLIIAIDGEADPALAFGSLVQLERFSRIDLGVELSIDLSHIRRGDNGLSKAHWALGTIRYSDDQVGHLVYIKSSVTGDEAHDVNEYRARNPTFPHESTADQFFEEDQFEAYRALGFHIADGLLGEGWKPGEFGIPVESGPAQTSVDPPHGDAPLALFPGREDRAPAR